ncbi:MAG: Na/Pi cotransporter family protein [Muribaculaceae bacterium]|nr:Na/Pi cotransporter family protein [Muribaculaceae bacterium]
MDTTQDYIVLLFKILGTLGLLIFGMRMMSTALQKMAGPQLRHVLGRMTTNRITGMLTGTAVTCAVQSSSATTVMTVSFVSAGLLTLGQAISVIMGANIGTTLTAWIMSLGYNVDLTNVVFPAFLVGILLIYHKRHRYIGDFLFGIAFMFFSLVLLSSAGKELDLEHNQAVMQFFASFDTSSHLTILAFLAIGTLITCIVQSSAAVMAITILLCSTGVLPIYLGIALVMGENIGTTATANLAALGANTEARRAALAHLMFNVFGVIWVMCVFYPFVDLVCRLVGYDPAVGGQVERLPVVLAMFHTCFNVTNTAILIGFIPQMEKLVRWMLPDKGDGNEEHFKLQYIKSHLIQTPEIAILQAQKETAHYGQEVQQMFGLVKDMMQVNDSDKLEEIFREIEKEEDSSDEAEINIARFLEQVSDGHLSDDSKNKTRQLLREIGELESIGDSCFRLGRTICRRDEQGKAFDEQQQSRLSEMMSLCEEALTQMNQVLNEPIDQHDIRQTYYYENKINNMRDTLKNWNINAVNDHQYDYAVGTAFGDLVGELEKLGDYIVNVVEARFGQL